MTLGDAIDRIFSHNEILAIWKKDGDRCDVCEWIGMAWRLPYWYRGIDNWKIFGTIPENIYDANRINIKMGD